MNSLSVKLKLPTRVQPEVMPKPGMAGMYTNKLHFIKKHVLDELTKKKFAADFMHPVDTEELQIPEYYKIIQEPMDVGTIIKRVENNYYRDEDECIKDLDLIIRNCFEFNRHGTSVFRKGVQLENFFQKTIQNMPRGPPLPCRKDPMTTIKLKPNAMEDAMEQLCRDQLKRLQGFTNQADATARNFFAPKWDSFSKKLDKQFFKSLEEFRSHVDGMFRKYHDPARMIYEKAYDQPGGYGGASAGADSFPVSSLPDLNVKELLEAVQMTESGLKQCLRQPQTGKSLVEAFCATVAQFRLKLEDIQSALAAQQESPEERDDMSVIVKQETYSAGFCLTSERSELLMDPLDGNISDDDPHVEDIGEAERRTIQKQFVKLPAWAMREIVAMVYSNEGVVSDDDENLTFDLNTFDALSVQMMKQAVAKTMKVCSKLNLRDMPPEEKEGLRCSLQSQLSELTQRLSQSRRKNAAPLTSDKNMKNKRSHDNDGGQKKGRKRARSKSPPQPGPGPTKAEGIAPSAKKAKSPNRGAGSEGSVKHGFPGKRGSVKPGFQEERGSVKPELQGERGSVKPGLHGYREPEKPVFQVERSSVKPVSKEERSSVKPGLQGDRNSVRPELQGDRSSVKPGPQGERCSVKPGLQGERGPKGGPKERLPHQKQGNPKTGTKAAEKLKSKGKRAKNREGYKSPVRNVVPNNPRGGRGSGKPEAFARFMAKNLNDSSDEDGSDQKLSPRRMKLMKKKQIKLVLTPGNILHRDLSMSNSSNSSNDSSSDGSGSGKSGSSSDSSDEE